MSVSTASVSREGFRGREPLLDLLRGLFLVMMTVDHLDGYLSTYCYEAFGFVTAAEGFVVLSGFVSAGAYGRILARDPGRLRWAIARRVALLYAAHAILVSLVLLTVWSRNSPPGPGDPYEPFVRAPVEYLSKALSFRFQPYLIDVLPMYVLFVVSLPLLLRALRRAPLVTFGVSIGLWILSWALEARTWVEGSGLFVFPSWQVLFVGGALLANLPERVAHGIRASRLATVAATLVIALGLVWRYGDVDCALRVSWLVERAELGPYRLLTVLGYVVLVSQCRETALARVRSKWLEHLGRHSLYVFVWHLPVVLWCKPHGFIRLSTLILRDSSTEARHFVLDLMVTGVAVASLSIPAVLHARWRSMRVRTSG